MILNDIPLLFFSNMLSLEWRIFYTCIATIIINLPFGYLRGGLQKFSPCWFIAIHAPVPLVILIRDFHRLDLTWSLAPYLLGSFFIGQFLGRKLWTIIPFRKKQYICKLKKYLG
jgi:hypothetical protein